MKLLLIIVTFVAVNGFYDVRIPFQRPLGYVKSAKYANITEYPYMVALELQGVQICGGSILSPHWILTAGHCVTDPIEDLTIRAGSSLRGYGGTVYQINKIIIHEKYLTTIQRYSINDIALIHLKEPIVFDETRQPISLFEIGEKKYAGLEAVITGWGEMMQSQHSYYLQAFFISIVSTEQCEKIYWLVDNGGIGEHQICAASYGHYIKHGKHVCQGHSGGPLVIDGRLAGVTSSGGPCDDRRLPGVYTEVAAYRKWIHSHRAVGDLIFGVI